MEITSQTLCVVRHQVSGRSKANIPLAALDEKMMPDDNANVAMQAFEVKLRAVESLVKSLRIEVEMVRLSMTKDRAWDAAAVLADMERRLSDALAFLRDENGRFEQ